VKIVHIITRLILGEAQENTLVTYRLLAERRHEVTLITGPAIGPERFLYNMVRNIVGTLVEIGTGRWEPQKMTEIIDAKNRTAAGRLAPPNGLCLMWIKYD